MINITNLEFGYPKGSSLFKNLNLEAQKGSIIGLLGKNGAGKSTLLRLMAGALKPKQGEINLMGYTPFERNPNFLQDMILVSEQIEAPTLKAKDYIKYGGAMYPKFDDSKMKSLCDKFELDQNKQLKYMSYGQQKKFLIAFALSTNCSVVLLDEPTNGLDIPSKSEFRQVVAAATTDEQIVIISTHQVKDVENLLDHIVLIEKGECIFNESVYETLSKFAFVSSSTKADDDIYVEESIGAYKIIRHNTGQETVLDIELLFNAITKGIKL